nr:13499_t:CDS:2 [Entrophospora candida]
MDPDPVNEEDKVWIPLLHVPEKYLFLSNSHNSPAPIDPNDMLKRFDDFNQKKKNKERDVT